MDRKQTIFTGIALGVIALIILLTFGYLRTSTGRPAVVFAKADRLEVRTVPVSSASVNKAQICIEVPQDEATFDPDKGIEQHCVRLNEIGVQVNPDIAGTMAELHLRFTNNDLCAMGGMQECQSTDRIIITVRTKAQQKQWNNIISDTRQMYFSPRDVELFDGNKPSAN